MALKVLVVEDDVPTLELIYEVLTSLGVEVRPISDSEQAATLITREKFDGVFLDLLMPKMDGFELARRIRRSPVNSRTPIAVVTGREEKETMRQAFAAGGTFFIQKPLDRNKLTHLLNSTRGVMLEERRRYKRISVRTEVACQVNSRKITGMSANLSQSGILFEGDGSPEPGSAVRLSFRLPMQERAIETEGVVVRVDEKQRVGARFIEMSVEDRQRIRDFVASQDRP